MYYYKCQLFIGLFTFLRYKLISPIVIDRMYDMMTVLKQWWWTLKFTT